MGRIILLLILFFVIPCKAEENFDVNFTSSNININTNLNVILQRIYELERRIKPSISTIVPNITDIEERSFVFMDGSVRKRMYIKVNGVRYFINLDHGDRLTFNGDDVFFNADIVFYEGL